MLLTRAERTDISRGIVNEAVSNHFIFTFEPLPTNASRAALNWTVVGAILRMHIGMGAVVKKELVMDHIIFTMVLTYFRRY